MSSSQLIILDICKLKKNVNDYEQIFLAQVYKRRTILDASDQTSLTDNRNLI